MKTDTLATLDFLEGSESFKFMCNHELVLRFHTVMLIVVILTLLLLISFNFLHLIFRRKRKTHAYLLTRPVKFYAQEKNLHFESSHLTNITTA